MALGKTHIWHYFSIICTEFVLRGAKNLGQFVREKSDIIFFDVYGVLYFYIILYGGCTKIPKCNGFNGYLVWIGPEVV